MVEIELAKATVMIDSMECHTNGRSKDFTNPLFDQGWRLASNWVFSLITDTEKCVRYSRLKSSKHI